jgi:hypothetical protein
MRDKGLHMRRHTGPYHGRFDRSADPRQRAELVELAGTGADVRHGAKVEIEVADIGAVWIDIRLLADHDVVDLARSPGVVRREPWHICARQVSLQPLQERHEIPDGEDMIFHESPQILDGGDLRVNGVVEQPLAKRGKAVAVLFLHV